jgi:hypothetical protein
MDLQSRNGATTLSIKTLSITTFSIKTPSIMTQQKDLICDT